MLPPKISKSSAIPSGTTSASTGRRSLALDTAPVQRLRYVRQLGHAFLVYPGATHTRFEHALGAYHLTRRALASLEERGELGGSPSATVWPCASRRCCTTSAITPSPTRWRKRAFPRTSSSVSPLGQGELGARLEEIGGAGFARDARRADPGGSPSAAAGPHLRLARPRQDRLPEPRRPHVRRPLRHGRRGPAARVAHAGRTRASRLRGRRAREGRQRARVAPVRQVPDVPQRLLAPRGPLGDLHVQARRARRGGRRRVDRGRDRRGHRRRADGAAHHPRRQALAAAIRARRLYKRAMDLPASDVPDGADRGSPRIRTCWSGWRTPWRAKWASRRARCC